MKKFKAQIFSALAAVTLFVGTLASNGACLFDYYQPKMPDKMRKE